MSYSKDNINLTNVTNMSDKNAKPASVPHAGAASQRFNVGVNGVSSNRGGMNHESTLRTAYQ